MPSKKFSLENGQPKNLEISWGLSFNNIVVNLNGQEIGRMANKTELQEGRTYTVANGSELKVQLIGSVFPELNVTLNGEPIPGSDSNPIQKLNNASLIIFLIAGFTILAGIITGAFVNLASSIPVVAAGLVSVALALMVRKGSLVALIIAIIMVVIEIISRIYLGAIWTIPVLLIMLIPLGRAIGAAREFKEVDPKPYWLGSAIIVVILIASGFAQFFITSNHGITVTMATKDTKQAKPQMMEQLAGALEERAKALGANYPSVEQQSNGTIIVEMPGVTDETAADLLSSRGNLEFKTGDGVTVLTNKDLLKAEAKAGDYGPLILLTFNKKGTETLAKITQENIGKVIGIYFDDQLILAPTIAQKITEGKIQITSGFTDLPSAERMAAIFKTKPLPLDVTIIKVDIPQDQ
ncbi:MAG: SecDF P1 head subdomain-containing protein [Ignavibacteriales bacterium]